MRGVESVYSSGLAAALERGKQKTKRDRGEQLEQVVNCTSGVGVAAKFLADADKDQCWDQVVEVTIHSCNSEDKTSVGVRTCQA